MTSTIQEQHRQEVRSGERFEFGDNWRRFLANLNEARIAQAEDSLRRLFRVQNLQGLRFLDIGSGSGLFSLAARRLGAQVHSFDYDPNSVACTEELRRRYFPNDPAWVIEPGSALDEKYLAGLPPHDIVYSWGVLHHTGQMWQALDNAGRQVRPGGRLMVALYNDEGKASRRWTWIKQRYNRIPGWLRPPVLLLFFVHFYWKDMVKDFLRLRPFHFMREYGRGRGMSVWRDLEDWVGGYPFEVAKPEEVFEFYRSRGFQLTYMRTVNNLGCNEFVFERQ